MSDFYFYEDDEEETTRTRQQDMTDEFFKAYSTTFNSKDREYAQEHMKAIIEMQMSLDYSNGVSDIPPSQLKKRYPSPFVLDFCWLMMVMSVSAFSAFTSMAFSASRGNSYFDPLSYILCFLSGIFYIALPVCLWELCSPVKRMPERTRTLLSVLIIIITYIVGLIICSFFNHLYAF
jgi:hypothetical protein